MQLCHLFQWIDIDAQGMNPWLSRRVFLAIITQFDSKMNSALLFSKGSWLSSNINPLPHILYVAEYNLNDIYYT